jgi:hypothetical protein
MLLRHCFHAGICHAWTVCAADVQSFVPVLVGCPFLPYACVALIHRVGSYNVRRRDVSVVDIALHRSVAVTIGVLWAAIVSRFWWPAEARRELSRALGE